MAAKNERRVMPRWLPRVNKVFTNRVQGLWAPFVPPYAMITHKGRKSGNEYQIPVVGFVRDGSFTIPLPYGTETDWVRNVIADGGAGVRRRGRDYQMKNPRIVTDPGTPGMPRAAKLALRRIDMLAGELAE